ncbi:S8 family peptidase [Lactobacillus sp. UCMA15818]|uniref:S8 family peptidase n=1 Tax=Lactobacillus sp. UCMA15818 TaxID=2583394 RepID=UPI0025AF8D53|nr:S8 family peptidase [Lactobacillus sp. UCMA15818]
MVEKRNIFLQGTEASIEYGGKPGMNGDKFPHRANAYGHGAFIQRKLKESYERSSKQKQAAAIRYKEGTYLEFTSAPDYDLSLNSLEDLRQGIKLLNVREESNKVENSDIDNDSPKTIKATVYVPEGKESFFLNKIDNFLNTDKKTKTGKPKNNDLINSIEDIHLAMLDSFWVGSESNMPLEKPEWCEVWLRYLAVEDETKSKTNLEEATNNFIQSCQDLGIVFDSKKIIFPERIVRLIFANKKQLRELIEMCDYIAEFRRAPESTNFFDELSGQDQQEWVDELLNRTEFGQGNASICLLDTGLASRHPLISPAIKNERTIQAVKKDWGTSDHLGHGTQMAGISIYNDLKKKFLEKDDIKINHKIESVKILPPNSENNVELYGAVTEDAVYLSEIENPTADRTICMAVTSSDFNTDDGSPTSWSAAIDNITSGSSDSNGKRLFLISAGNVYGEEIKDLNYPDSNILHGVENPGQSWNAITVGAYANDIEIESSVYNNCKPLADVDELSPYSSTSRSWDSKWPIKPEILLDGGNMVTNGDDISECEDLELLTTNRNFFNRPFSTLGGTSSATAQASWMAAQIYDEYPGIWPETVRALMIHSANWSNRMIQQFCSDDKKTTGRRDLLRTCGYGIPNLNKALECKSNSVNLVVESELQPFSKGKKMNEMNIHQIPWPKEILKSLGETEVKLKVTLSYFIEPSPGERGWKNKYRYSSAGLRFDVINSDETLAEFKKRINYKMRDETTITGSSRKWYLGTTNRDVGSIHSDFCKAPAVDLCDVNYVAVYPVIGWWRERPNLGRFNNRLRYSLIVSIETPETKYDLYTAITNQITNKQEIEIDTNI